MIWLAFTRAPHALKDGMSLTFSSAESACSLSGNGSSAGLGLGLGAGAYRSIGSSLLQSFQPRPNSNAAALHMPRTKASLMSRASGCCLAFMR